MFKLLNDGEKVVGRVMRRLPEDTRFSFGIGLAGLLILVALVAMK